MYITDYHQQQQLISDMTQVRKDQPYFAVYFYHQMSEQMWKSFFPRKTEKEFGPRLMRHEPLPSSLSRHLLACLGQPDTDNAKGLGLEFSSQIERWPEIVETMEQDRGEYNKEQVRTFIKHLRLYRYQENFRELGIRLEELPFSEKELKNLVWRARKLRVKSVFF